MYMHIHREDSDFEAEKRPVPNKECNSSHQRPAKGVRDEEERFWSFALALNASHLESQSLKP